MIQIRNTRQIDYSMTQQNLKLNNTMLVYNLIRDLMPISRVDLARRSPFSTSTISNLVEDLLQGKWIIETQIVQTSARGRRSTLLEVNASRGYVATVELLGRGYICTIYNICLQKITGTRIRNTGYDSNSIASTIHTLLKTSHIASCMLIGIHLIYPGIVDPISGELLSSCAFPDSDILERHLVIQLKKLFRDTHVMISTNGTIIAFQEFVTQKELPHLPLLSFNVDEAIFGGMVASDADNTMTFCYPVEIGHLVVDYHGKRCKCGNQGCLETLCRTPALFQTINARTDLNLQYSETFGSDLNTSNMSLIAQRLRENDAKVIAVMQEYTQTLSIAIGSIANLLNVQSIHIGGDIALLGNPFLQMLKDHLSQHHAALNMNQVRLELFVNDYEQVRLAATMMCLDAIFKK